MTHDHGNVPKEFEKKVPSAMRHNQLIERMAQINLELVNVINELASYIIEISDEEVELAAKSIIDQGSKIHLTPLADRMEMGIPDTMLATFNIKTGKVHPASKSSDQMTLRIIEFLLNHGEYVKLTDDESIDVFCVEIRLPNNDKINYRKSNVIFETTQKDTSIATIGPNRQIRLKKSIEELKDIFVEHNYDSSELDELMRSTAESLGKDEVIYVNLEPTSNIH